MRTTTLAACSATLMLLFTTGRATAQIYDQQNFPAEDEVGSRLQEIVGQEFVPDAEALDQLEVALWLSPTQIAIVGGFTVTAEIRPDDLAQTPIASITVEVFPSFYPLCGGEPCPPPPAPKRVVATFELPTPLLLQRGRTYVLRLSANTGHPASAFTGNSYSAGRAIVDGAPVADQDISFRFRKDASCDPDLDGKAYCLGALDNCPDHPNADQRNSDGDALGDVCDPLNDIDEDGVADDQDNCPFVPNADQDDDDEDGLGDECDELDGNDLDDDGVDNDEDACPFDEDDACTSTSGCSTGGGAGLFALAPWLLAFGLARRRLRPAR